MARELTVAARCAEVAMRPAATGGHGQLEPTVPSLAALPIESPAR